MRALEMFLVSILVKDFSYSLSHNPHPAETSGPTPQGCPQPQQCHCWDSACPGQGCTRLLLQAHTDLLAPLFPCPSPPAVVHIGCNSQSNIQMIAIQAWQSATASRWWGDAPAAQWAHKGQGIWEKWPLFITYMQETCTESPTSDFLCDTICVCHH